MKSFLALFAVSLTLVFGDIPVAQAGYGQPYPDRLGVQTYLLKARQFFYSSRAVLSATLNERASDYYGSPANDEVANIRVTFRPNGSIEEVAIESDDPWIRATLANSINWNFLPRPSEFSLPYRAVDITVQFDAEGVSIRMDPH